MIVNKYANGGGGSTSGVTPQDVQQQINSALTPYWESGETKDYVDEAVSGIDLSNYYTSAQTEDAITSKNYVTSAQVETQIVSKNYITSAETANFVTSAQVETQIDTKAAAYTPTTGFSTINGSAITNGGNIVIEGGADMSAYYTSAQTDAAIAQAVSGLATEQYVQDALSGVNMDNYWTSAETQDAIDEALSAYTPTTGFSTINGSAITNGGNIVISGPDVSNYVTSAQVETQIVEKNYVTSAQVETQMVAKNYITSADTANFVTSAQVETQIQAKNYVNSGDVKSQVEAYNYATVSQIPTVPTSNTAFTNDAGYITDAAIENLVTSAQVETQIDTKAAAYTPTSGFSTINGSAITNGGDIVIEGGADMSAYYTSAQTEDAISVATDDMKTYTDNRIDGYDSAVTLTRTTQNQPLKMNGSNVYEADEVGWSALGLPWLYTTNMQQYDLGNAPGDPDLGRPNYVKFSYVGETNYTGDWTGVYYALPANGEFIEGVPVQLTRTTVAPETVYTTPAGAGSGYFIWDNVNLTITWNRQPVIEQHVPGVATEQYVQDALSGVSLEGYYTSAQTEEAITSKNYVTSAQVETQMVAKNYITSAEIADFVTSAQVETQITSKGYATVSQIPTVPTSNTAFTNDAGYVTSAQVETQIVEKNYITSAAIANMVTSTYVSTIWRGTQSDYDAIVDKDPNTFYIIVSN